MNRAHKRLVLMAVEGVTAPLALLLTILMVYPAPETGRALRASVALFPIMAAIAVAASAVFRLHRVQLKAYETRAIVRTGGAAAVCGCAFVALSPVVGLPAPRAEVFLFALLVFMLSVCGRLVMKQLLFWVYRAGRPTCRVLIYGAGTTGIQLATALHAHETIMPVAFIDDDPALLGLSVAGLTVHSARDLRQVVASHGVDRVLLAMPSVSQPKQMRIARRLRTMGLEVLALPSFAQLIGVEELVGQLRPVRAAHFLGRDQLDRDLPDAPEAYSGKAVLVSGAGGSIGSELCRQLLTFRPRRLVLFEVSEVALYHLHMELRDAAASQGTDLVPVLGSVTDVRLSRQAMEQNAVEVVFHAAAYKHVPLVESNPVAGVANNVLGTRVFADAAESCGVGRFILVSTDKAVRPANVMGASKRIAEMVVQDLARRARHTAFSMVRFGNVLGSSGSVVPLFQQQIARGGPVTLTHEDVSRFFMTVSEAARLVLVAGSFTRDALPGDTADVFVLDMGAPVKIRDLARQMIEAQGYTVRDADHPDGDIEIVVTGLRPGEKMTEELLIGAGLLTTPHPKILRAREDCLSEIEIAHLLQSLRGAVAAGDGAEIRKLVRDWVSDAKTAPRPPRLAPPPADAAVLRGRLTEIRPLS